MSVVDVVQSCLRRFPILLIGLALTVGGAIYIQAVPGVYWARSKVVLLGPAAPIRPNKLDSNSAGLVATAGLIAQEMNAKRSYIPATSPDVTIVDQGIYDGEIVRVPNYGGQWASNFTDPILDIEASGNDPLVVKQRINDMISEAEGILTRRQDEAGVRPNLRITIAVSPEEVQVYYSSGNRRRGTLAWVMLAVATTLATATKIDLAHQRRAKETVAK